MNRLSIVAGIFALGLLVTCGRTVFAQQAADSQSMAPLWAVHIDEVRPEMAKEFERLNILENTGVHEIMRKYGQPIRGVYEYVTAGNVYFSLRPKQSYTDLDKPSTIPDSVSKLFATVTDSLDAPIHAALKCHYNQLWRYQAGSSYIPLLPGAKVSTPGYVQLISERVTPRMQGRYSELVDTLMFALKKCNYPGEVLLFSSTYGDGVYRYFWQADSREAFDATGDRGKVLELVFGKEAASKMLAELKSCVESSETVDAAARRDYTDLDSSFPWLGKK